MIDNPISVADPGISKRGGARSRRGTIFRSGVCFDAPSNIPYVFVARVVNKIHNINIVNWLKSKYMRVIQSKFTTTNPNFFQNGGGARPARRSWIRLCICDGSESQFEKKQQQSLGTSLFSGVLSIDQKTHVFLTLSSFVVHTTVFSENIVNIYLLKLLKTLIWILFAT